MRDSLFRRLLGCTLSACFGLVVVLSGPGSISAQTEPWPFDVKPVQLTDPRTGASGEYLFVPQDHPQATQIAAAWQRRVQALARSKPANARVPAPLPSQPDQPAEPAVISQVTVGQQEGTAAVRSALSPVAQFGQLNMPARGQAAGGNGRVAERLLATVSTTGDEIAGTVARQAVYYRGYINTGCWYGGMGLATANIPVTQYVQYVWGYYVGSSVYYMSFYPYPQLLSAGTGYTWWNSGHDSNTAPTTAYLYSSSSSGWSSAWCA